MNNRSSLLLLLMALHLFGWPVYAAEQPLAVPPAVSLQVSWVDWSSPEIRDSENINAEQHRDRKLETRLSSTLATGLDEAGIHIRREASPSINVSVEATTIVRRYKDSLYGTINNRPAEYAGKFYVRIYSQDKKVTEYVDKFSFKSTYSAGRTSTAMSKVKTIGLINQWLSKHVRKKKFRKYLQPS